MTSSSRDQQCLQHSACSQTAAAVQTECCCHSRCFNCKIADSLLVPSPAAAGSRNQQPCCTVAAMVLQQQCRCADGFQQPAAAQEGLDCKRAVGALPVAACSAGCSRSVQTASLCYAVTSQASAQREPTILTECLQPAGTASMNAEAVTVWPDAARQQAPIARSSWGSCAAQSTARRVCRTRTPGGRSDCSLLARRARGAPGCNAHDSSAALHCILTVQQEPTSPALHCSPHASRQQLSSWCLPIAAMHTSSCAQQILASLSITAAVWLDGSVR